MKPVIRVDVVSDVVCPWCYIGKRRLEKAVDSLRDQYDFDIVYHPFELNPDMPEEGRDQKEYLGEKFGSIERYHELTGQVSSVAATEGLELNFAKQNRSPNTRKAHRIIQLASGQPAQLPLVEGFFKAYFTEGKDLSKHENLVAIAAHAGLEKTKVENLLASDEQLAEVVSIEKEMHGMGITGVPFYIVNNKYGLSGAQPSKTFVDAFTQVAKELATTKGESCDVEGENC